MTLTHRPNGFILHETDDIVVIATGFRRRSANPKTGDMIQVWILPRAVNPVEAVKTGADAAVCFDCKHRGIAGKGRTCYVRVANAPLGVWKAYARGMYSRLDIADYAQAFSGRKVRFGAYGEPVLIPVHIVAEIARVASGHTGYTHQWKQPVYAPYRAFVMASCDTPQDYLDAKSAGWRTFRVRTAESPLMPREIACPASEESGKRTTCADCKLCSGARANDPRKDISIIAHGSGAKKFAQLIQIAA
jgi:hypothetical protein